LIPNTTTASQNCANNITHTTEKCNKQNCPTDGGWTEWGACSKECGGGKKTRECSFPHPKDGGKDCEGEKEADCNDDACEAGGYVANDNAPDCGELAVKDYEECGEAAAYLGVDDYGDVLKENDPSAPPGCYLFPDALAMYFNTNTGKNGDDDGMGWKSVCRKDASSQKKEDSSTQEKQALAVDGALSAWSAFGTCGTICGAGIQKRVRTCTAPVNGGKPCSGPTEDQQDCNLGDCPGLKWVTDEAWGKMSGGKAGNPAVVVSHSSIPYHTMPVKDFSMICRFEYKNCQQTGWLSLEYNPWKCYAAQKDWYHYSARFEILVNPGNKNAIKWMSWNSDKKTFPAKSVFGSTNCNLIVARYHYVEEGTSYYYGAQVTASDGMVHNGWGSGSDSRNNDYDILVEATGWTEWSECSTKCGGGTKTRECTGPKSKDGGKDCEGEKEAVCNVDACGT